MLNLVDLAGCERLMHSKARGDGLEEAKNINKSLENVGIMIGKLSKRCKHILYRDSLITKILCN